MLAGVPVITHATRHNVLAPPSLVCTSHAGWFAQSFVCPTHHPRSHATGPTRVNDDLWPVDIQLCLEVNLFCQQSSVRRFQGIQGRLQQALQSHMHIMMLKWYEHWHLALASVLQHMFA